MADKKEKIFAGGGKKRSDTWFQATLKPKVINQHIKEFNGNEYVKININILAEPDKFGKNVEITIDTWEPPKKEKEESLPF